MFNLKHSESISSKHYLQELWSNNVIEFMVPEIWVFKDTRKWQKKRLSIYRSIYLSIYMSHDNLHVNRGSGKPPSRDQIHLKFFLPSVQQWSRRFAKFQDPSSILTWFSRPLKLAILGNRGNFVLLCWQVTLTELYAKSLNCDNFG